MLTRRSLLQRTAAAFAGCLIARMPLSGYREVEVVRDPTPTVEKADDTEYQQLLAVSRSVGRSYQEESAKLEAYFRQCDGDWEKTARVQQRTGWGRLHKSWMTTEFVYVRHRDGTYRVCNDIRGNHERGRS